MLAIQLTLLLVALGLTLLPLGAAAADGTSDTGQATEPDPCVTPPTDSLPRPGDPSAQDFWRAFRLPLPAVPAWNPPGVPRVGLQAGHWLNDQVPAELRGLQAGSFGAGRAEWQVTLDLAQRTAGLLAADGVRVDVLPATVPPHYQAHVFVAIHADGDPAGQARGFKVARPGFAAIPDVDDQLVDALNRAYGLATGLPRDDEHISRRMLYYYAFNSRRYCHAVDPGVPQAIIETGYLTNMADWPVLIDQPDLAAQGLANGIEAFLAAEGHVPVASAVE